MAKRRASWATLQITPSFAKKFYDVKTVFRTGIQTGFLEKILVGVASLLCAILRMTFNVTTFA